MEIGGKALAFQINQFSALLPGIVFISVGHSKFLPLSHPLFIFRFL